MISKKTKSLLERMREARNGNGEDFLEVVRRGPSNRTCDTNYNAALYELVHGVVADAATNGRRIGSLICVADALHWPREWTCFSDGGYFSGLTLEKILASYRKMTPGERTEAVERYLGKGFRATSRHERYEYARKI